MGDLKILVIGGCHVDGWLVGRDNSFTAVLNRQLNKNGVKHQVISKPYVLITQKEDILSICNEVKPDILICQFGNYEFSPSLIAKVRKSLKKIKPASGRKSKSQFAADSSSDEEEAVSELNPNRKFIKTTQFKFTQLVKHVANSLIFYSYFDKDKWHKLTEDLFFSFKKLVIKNVIILGPFPTSNIVTNVYRRKGNEIFKQEADKQGFNFLDVFSIFDQEITESINTIDEMHLNIESHYLLGNSISDIILSKNI